jgi:hypothetical protein
MAPAGVCLGAIDFSWQYNVPLARCVSPERKLEEFRFQQPGILAPLDIP